MISVFLHPHGLDVTGHAPADIGEDRPLLCAAMSELTQTTIDALQEIAHAGVNRIRVEPGDVSVTWDGVGADGTVILETYMLGVSRLAATYPGAITYSVGT